MIINKQAIDFLSFAEEGQIIEFDLLAPGESFADSWGQVFIFQGYDEDDRPVVMSEDGYYYFVEGE